jgi:rhamnosyltransferase
VSITVAFEPDIARLAQQLRALHGQVDAIVLVDNGSSPAVERLLADNRDRYPELREAAPRVVTLAANEGMARGLNLGIAAARECGAAFVVLLDDDSVPAHDMVAQLLDAHARCAQAQAPVAALGPRVSDARDKRDYPFIRLGWLRNHHAYCDAARDAVIPCDFLITSGKLLPVAMFDAVGPFEDGLFIDSVDREWCFRARSRGFALYGACAARLDHRLGESRRPAAFGLELVVHSPERLYYMTRNRFLLYQRGYVPLEWKLKDFLRVLAKFAATMLFVSPRGQYARMTGRAIRDALARRGGKLDVTG